MQTQGRPGPVWWYNGAMEKNAIAFLQVLQLADSALPIGTAAHSFGLETLVAQQWLDLESLERFLRAYLVAGSECASQRL